MDSRTKGSILRSHAEHDDSDEKQNKHLLTLERRNYENKCIT